MNPYIGANFFEFWAILFSRIFQFFSGQSIVWASDEIQMAALVLTGFGCACTGSWLVLKKMSMMANALAHTLLLGIVIAFLCFQALGYAEQSVMQIHTLKGWMIAGFSSCFLTGFCIWILSHKLKVHQDASIGLIFSALFALGVVLVTTVARQAHLGLEVIMGSADLISSEEIPRLLLIAGGLALTSFVLARLLWVSSFDALFCKTLGWSQQVVFYIILLMSSVLLMMCFRVIGAFLTLGLLVGIPLFARSFARSVWEMFYIGTCFSTLLSLISVALARHALSCWYISLSTGAVAICLCWILTFSAIVYKRYIPRKQQH